MAFADASPEFLASEPDAWVLHPNETWHGFGDLEDGFCMLDPIKVSILTPGVTEKGGLDKRGIPASLLTALLSLAASPDQAELSGIFAGLPVAAWSGTLAKRFDEPDAGAGVVRAKTGTLFGVHAIAGTVTTREGRSLGFAFLADEVPAAQEVARELLDQAATALATCGCI